MKPHRCAHAHIETGESDHGRTNLTAGEHDQ